ncbi:MAG: TolC family protein [Burkholderiales bacterium]|nr:TolC family protein [Burkholderiales bacterium]
MKRFHRDSENTLIFDVAIPLPLFDRNQGNLQAAYQRLDKSQDEQRATELRITTDLVQTYEALAAAENQIKSLRNQILPDAKSAFEAANKGYQLGKFGFLEVLDAQRTLSQNQALHLQAVAAYQGLVADLERLVASPLDRTIKN